MPMLMLFILWFASGIISFRMYTKLVSSKGGTYILDLKGLLMAVLVVITGVVSFIIVGAVYLQKMKPTIHTD